MTGAHRREGCKRLLFSLLAAFAAGSAEAGTTGQLAGTVIDENGDALPGISVSASSPEQIGGIQITQTNTDGWFHYPRLAPGRYTVLIEAEGLVTQELTEVEIRLDRLTEVRVTLPEATFLDEVVVAETTPVVDTEQVSLGQVFTSDYLKDAALGMDNRHYLQVLTQAAGVTDGGVFRVRVLGSTGFENSFLVDGIEFGDPHDQLPSFSTLNLEAVHEIALHTSGFEAQYGLATGGVINLITKSGGNQLGGSFDVRYKDSSFSSSGDHHDPEAEPFETRDVSASLGGPVRRDRLWFFLSAQTFEDQSTPTGAPSTTELDEHNFLGKLTWQASSGWSVAGKILGNPSESSNSTASQFRAPEADSKENWEVLNAHVDASGVLSENLLLGVRLSGQQASYELVPDDGDLTTIGHFNLDTGVADANWPFLTYDDRERTAVGTDLTWFVDGNGGSHEAMGGLGYTRTRYAGSSCNTGSGQACPAGAEGFLFLDIVDSEGGALPFQMNVGEAVGRRSFPGSIWSAYLQDTWRIRPDITLKAGLRWDLVTQDDDVGQRVAELELLQPRLGLAWDVLGDGRNILRASWGQFMNPSSLHIAEYTAQRSTPLELWLSCSLFVSSDPGVCASVASDVGLGYRADPEAWDEAGWFLDPELVFLSTPNQASPDLDPMYTDEASVAFEREIFRRTALELSWVKKTTHDLIDDTCEGNIPTPATGAPCGHFVVANIPGARRHYEGWLLRFESRALDRLHLIGSYVYSDSKGSVEGWDIGPSFDIYPFHFVNRYGYLSDHSRHRVKVNGFVRLPWDLTLGAGGYWSSEFRWSPTSRNVPGMNWGMQLLEPRGSRRETGSSQLDLQLSKGFQLGRSRLRLIGTVYNVLSSERAVDVCRNVSGCGGLEMGEAVAWQLPRRYEAGVRIDF